MPPKDFESPELKLNRLVEEIREIPELDETTLARLMRKLDGPDKDKNSAIDDLCEGHLWLLLSLTKEYTGEDAALTLEIYENNLPILRLLVESFDTVSSTRLKTHITWRLRQSIVEELSSRELLTMPDDDDTNVVDFRSTGFGHSTTQELLAEDLNKAMKMANLTELEKKVLILRFGLSDGQSRTLDEVAKMLNLTRQKVREIEAAALRTLRRR